MKLQRRRALTLDPPRTRLYILCLFFAAGMLAGHLACRAVPSDDLTALRSYVMGYAQLSSEERGCAGLAQVVWVYFRYPAAAFLLGFTAWGVMLIPLVCPSRCSALPPPWAGRACCWH